MTGRTWYPRFLLIVALLLAAGLVSVEARQPDAVALARIPWEGDACRPALEAAGVPVYARLFDHRQSYLLVGASPDQVATLQRAGVKVELLDANISGATYYLAYRRPGSSPPDWGAYGDLLLEDGVQALLRMSGRDAKRLAQAGADIRALQLDAKPLPARAPAEVFPMVTKPDPVIQALIDQVSGSIVNAYTGDLSGAWPASVGGGLTTITTRYTDSGEPVRKAVQYAGEHLAGLGLEVEYHQWSASRPANVIGELPGLVNPDDILIICAHLDDMPSGSLAPGADDNASGSVAVLVAADILSQYTWGNTLRFALWTGEEQGLLGSYAYAQRAVDEGENIVGVLNLDMISWNSRDSRSDIELHADPDLPVSSEIARLFSSVVQVYDLDLVPQIVTYGSTGGSDHASFWAFGYPAILGIEDLADFNPYYHTTADSMDKMDKVFFEAYIRASVGAFAHMAGGVLAEGVGTLQGVVTAAEDGSLLPGVALSVSDAGSRVFTTATDASGHYSRALPAGIYHLSSEFFGYLPASVNAVEVVDGAERTLDLALLAAPDRVISGTVRVAVYGTPLSADVSVLDAPIAPVLTNPSTGRYTLIVPQGDYTVRATATAYLSQTRQVSVAPDLALDFDMEPGSCILLVDDDKPPDVRLYYTAALDSLGYTYDVFDVGGGAGDGPSLAMMQDYAIVVWFSGTQWSAIEPAAGPNAMDEVRLMQYLDGGGWLLLSSQGYLPQRGLTELASDYLGVDSFVSFAGDATSIVGVDGDPIGGGLGSFSMTLPVAIAEFGSIVNPDATASVAFRGQNGNNLDIDKDGGDWRTVFFGTSWVPVYYADAADGTLVLQRVIEWLGGCPPTWGRLSGNVTDAASAAPLAEVQVNASWDGVGERQVLTGPDGTFTMGLPAASYHVTASRSLYFGQDAGDVVVLAGEEMVRNLVLEPWGAIRLPLVLRAH